MAAAGVPRKSLDVESSRSPSSAAQNAPTQKTLKRMFQDTLRVTGLSRQRARDEQLSPPPPSDKRKEKDKDKQKPPEETKRGFISTFTRKPKLSISGGTGTNNDGDERPFMGSLRHASMSSPVLPLFSNPIITHRDAPARQGSSTHATNNVSPVRPRASSRRSSTSRDRDPSSAPLQISRPRALAPASPSSPTFPQNSSRATRGVSPPPQRNQSPTSRITRFPSISTSNLPSSSVQRTVSPTFYSRNTSTTSLIASSPFRETIRTASSLLIKHLSRPPPPLKAEDWHDVEVRLRALARLERIWGKSGGGGSSTTAVGTTASGFGGGEDRERRLFCETVRDGYVLCALLNKFRPGTIPRPDPKEDGFAKTSNVTKFLAGALHYGISNSDLFMRNDLLEASSESLGRVAQTIIAVVKLGEPSQPAIDGNRGPYMSVRDGSISSPNLLDSRSLSPSRPGHKKRYSPPSNLPPVPGSSSGKPAPTPIGTRQTRSTSMTGRPSDFPQEAMYHNSAFAPSAPPPRSPLRPTVSPRASVASGTTDSTTGFSLLDNRASARFATMRSGTTEATSIHPSETSSIIGARRDSKPGPELPVADQPPPSNQTQFTDLPSMNRRRSYDREASAAKLAAAQLDVSPTRVRRERRSSDLLSPDLSNVEEVDEMGTRRGRPFIDMPDWSLLNPTSASLPAAAAAAPAVSPLRRTSFDRPRVSFEEPADSVNPASGIDLTSTPPPKAKAGLPMRRPVHGHRHSVDTVSTTPALLPVPRHTSLNRERDGQPSPSSSRESSTPSPPTGASRPSLVPKRSTSRPSPRASYVPKLSGTDDPRRRHTGESSQIETSPSAPAAPRVPFPRSTSGDLGNAGTAGISRLAPLSTSSEVGTSGEAAAGDSAIGSSRNISPNGRAARPVLPRSRYNSELDTTRARKQRPNSLDDGDARPGRSRFESMMNLGTSVDALTRDSSMSVNAIRQPLIVREEGKPPMHYQIGNGIGRGQFGAVYRALNLNTGQMVAVKRIGLQDLSEDEISNLMKEVDVLKRLSHPSIVKYEGMVRSTDTLSIVLEYVENGSLGQTIRAFGKLNERLVASYITKILEGLHYLHTSHVVHCDLKAANILTTKNGNVKLSDFGVSLNLHAKALEEIKNDVAGTPNWMAPEVIELKGASTASDIWSLGCTAIELLTGHPPYHEIHNGLSVMFRIVEDPLPPIPEMCSPLMEDFLKQCFKKNPKERPSAEMLFEHPWLKTAWGEHKELRPQDSIPFLRRVSVELAKSEGRSLSVDTRGLNLSDSPRNTFDIGSRSNVSGSQPAPLTPLSPNSSEGPMRSHSFIKTTFGRAVLCRVCLQSVKRSAVLCEECGLIAHARCAADAPASCDVRAQLLLYSQYSQASLAQEVSTPTQESASPAASAPIPIPGSPSFTPRKRRQSDATFSSSPKLTERLLGGWKRSNKSPEPVSPPLPPVAGPSSYAYHPPRDETPTPTPATFGSPKSPILVSSSPKAERMRKPSRLSFQSAAHTDSMRSMVTAAETVSSSTPEYDSTPRSSVAPARRQPIPPTNPAASTTNAESTTSNTRRLVTRSSVISNNASEFGEERRRIKRNQRDSVSSKDSQCIIQ